MHKDEHKKDAKHKKLLNLLCIVYNNYYYLWFSLKDYAKQTRYHICPATGPHSAVVTCLTTDERLTADPGSRVWSHTFVEIDHEIISTVILLLSADSFKKGCCQLQAKVSSNTLHSPALYVRHVCCLLCNIAKSRVPARVTMGIF